MIVYPTKEKYVFTVIQILFLAEKWAKFAIINSIYVNRK